MERTYRPTGKRTYIPFASNGTVAAGASATITVTPQLEVRPDRLVIDETTGANFDVAGINIGVYPQAAVAGPVSALVFSPKQTAADMALDVANSSTSISLVVTNTSGSAAAFKGVLFADEVAAG